MNKIATVVGFFEETKGPQIQFDGEEKPAEKEYPYLLSYTPKVDDKVFCMEFGNSYIIIGKVNYQEEPFNLDATLEEAIKPTKDGLATLEETHAKFETTIQTLDGSVQTAISTANEANTTAESALSKANSASSTASSAKSAADTAKTTATSAQTTANNASSTAAEAKSTASDASTKAQKAVSEATSAMTAANAAKSAANDAYNRSSYTKFSASGPIGFFGTTGKSKRSVVTTTSTDAGTLKNKLNEVIQALQHYGLM